MSKLRIKLNPGSKENLKTEKKFKSSKFVIRLNLFGNPPCLAMYGTQESNACRGLQCICMYIYWGSMTLSKPLVVPYRLLYMYLLQFWCRLVPLALSGPTAPTFAPSFPFLSVLTSSPAELSFPQLHEPNVSSKIYPHCCVNHHSFSLHDNQITVESCLCTWPLTGQNKLGNINGMVQY